MNCNIINNILKVSFVHNNIEYKNIYDIRILDKNIMNNLTMILKSNYNIEQNNNTLTLIYNFINPLTSKNIDFNFKLYNATLGQNESLLLREEYMTEINILQEQFSLAVKNQPNHNDIINTNTHNIKKLISDTNIIKSKISRLFWLAYREERKHHNNFPNYPEKFVNYT